MKGKTITKKMMDHNQPPLTIEDFFILDVNGNITRRIKLINAIIKKYLTEKIEIIKKNIDLNQGLNAYSKVNIYTIK